MPKVSIIIATHSRPQLLPRAVESAFAAGDAVEVVVVDDASTDETAAVCRKIEKIKYVRVDRNQRTAGARNIGIVNASAEYIGFLDDDDWRLPGVLNEQIKVLDENPRVGLVYTPYFMADQDGNFLGERPIPDFCPQGDVFWDVMRQNPIGCLTAVFRRECVSRVGLLDQTIPGTDDIDMWIRIAELYELAVVQKPAAVWRRPTPESGQGSSNLIKLYAQVIRNFDQKWSKLPRAAADPQKLREVRRAFVDNLMNEMMLEAARAPKLKDAVSRFCAALNARPEYLYRLRTHKTIARMLLNKTLPRRA